MPGRAGGANAVPRVVGRMRRTRPVEVDDLRFLRAHTDRTIKITLPGPFTMSQQAANEAYDDEAEKARAFALPAIDRALEGVSGTTALHTCFGYAHVVHDRPAGYPFLAALAGCAADILAIEAALQYIPAEQLQVGPDCGMKYLSRDVAFGKLRGLVEGAALVRGRLAGRTSAG